MSQQTVTAEVRTRHRCLDPRLAGILGLVLDLALPSLVFYGLRAMGVSQWWALVIGGLAAAVRVLWALVRERRLNGVALFTLSMLVVGTAISLVTGDPRLLLARESWLTAVVGLWMLASLLAARPVIFTGAKLMMTEKQAADWEASWAGSADFRHVMRAGTVIWAAMLIADAGVRVVMAYTLPVDWVPALTVAQFVVLVVLMQVAVRLYGRVYGRRKRS